MNRNILMGVGMATVMAVGLVAQTQDPTRPDPQTQPRTQSASADDRKVTVQGCLERDYLYTPTGGATGTTGTGGTTAGRTAQNMSPTPFKLTQVEVIKDEAASSATSSSSSSSGSGTSSSSSSTYGTTGQTGTTSQQKSMEQKDKDIELHVAAASGKDVDLDAQVNHKVELQGTMSSKDLNAIKGKGTMAGGQSGTGTNPQTRSSDTQMAPPLLFKATSIKSIADKCQ